MSAATFNRAEAITEIREFAGDTHNPEGFMEWLESLTDDQLRHYYTEIKDAPKEPCITQEGVPT